MATVATLGDAMRATEAVPIQLRLLAVKEAVLPGASARQYGGACGCVKVGFADNRPIRRNGGLVQPYRSCAKEF